MSNQTTVRRSSFYSLFFTLLLVIVIPLSIVLVFFITTASTMVREDYLSLNRQNVSNICDTLNTSINSRLNLSYSLNLNPHVRKLANSSMDISASELREDCQNINFILKGSHVNNSLFSQTALYFPERDLMIGMSNPRMSPEVFYKEHLKLADLSADEFFASLSLVKDGRFLNHRSDRSTASEGSSMIMYVQPVVVDYLLPRAYFITIVNNQAFSDLILSSFEKGTHFQLHSSEGALLLQSEGIPDALAHDGHPAEQTIKNGRDVHYVFSGMNAQTGLKYTFFVPQASVLKQLNLFLVLWFAVLAACLLIGVILARAIARRVYTPFQNLLYEAFPGGPDEKTRSIQAEMELVVNKMRADQHRSLQTETELRTYYETLRTTMLMRLLTSSANMNSETLSECAEIADIPATHAIYRAALFEQSSADVGAPFDMQMITGCTVRNVRLSSTQCLFLLISTPQSLQEDEDMFFAALSSDHPMGMRIGVSRSYEELRHLQRCLSESSAACRHHTRSGEPFVTYDTLLTTAETIDYPVEKEMQLLAAVRSGSFEETSELLHTILTDNVQNRRLVPATTRLLYSSLIATAMKAYDQLRTEAAPILTENLQTLSNLQERREPDQHVFEEILRCYGYLCNASAQSNQHKNHQVMENVQAFLENGYANPSLCLDMVADHLGVSYYFLSRIFKEEANMSFSDLLNDIRVRHAMELLSSTATTVQEISAAVGYTNWSTFLRAFRKRTGTTPVQYRKEFQTAAAE